MAVSTGAGKLNDVPVSPEVARFVRACITLGVATLGNHREQIALSIAHLEKSLEEMDYGVGTPADAVWKEFQRIGGV